MRLKDKIKAVNLRIEGKTHREIRLQIPNLAKSTLSNWLSNLKLTPKQEKKLKNNLEKINYNAKARSAWTHREKKKKRVKKFFEEAKNEYRILSKDPFFLVCLSLYWAEGNKKTQQFQFTNSDPCAIKAIMRWLLKICKIPKNEIRIRLYTHRIFASENYEKFWSKITGISINNFQKTILKETPHRIKKNPNYKGCIQLRVLKTAFYWRVMGWLKELTTEYNL